MMLLLKGLKTVVLTLSTLSSTPDLTLALGMASATVTILNDDAPIFSVTTTLSVLNVLNADVGKINVTGTAEPDSNVTITFTDNSMVVVTASASDGSFSVTSTNRLGSGNVNVSSEFATNGVLNSAPQTHTVFDFGDRK